MTEIAKAIEPGIYPDLSNEAYHADPAIGSSGLKRFNECPALYHYDYLTVGGRNSSQTKAESVGSAAHIALLEPKKFNQLYLVSPQMATVNKGKKNQETKPMNKTHGEWNEFEQWALKEGKTPLLYSEFQKADAMAASIKESQLASAIFSNGRAEVSFFCRDEITGLMVKAKPDHLSKVPGYGKILVDYKTTEISMSNSTQSRHAFNLGRHIQAACHKTAIEQATGGKIDHVIYVTHMQKPPHLLRFFRMPEECLDIGMTIRNDCLQRMAECRESGKWPSYAEEIDDYIMPKWMDYDFN